MARLIKWLAVHRRSVGQCELGGRSLVVLVGLGSDAVRMAERRPAGASAERQANFVAGREEHRERQRDERERAAALRAAGCEDEEAYHAPDWDDAHGAWLVPVVELLGVSTPDVLSGRAHRRGRAEAEAERRADEDAAAAALAAVLAELADDVLDEDEVVRGEEGQDDGGVEEEAAEEAEDRAAVAEEADAAARALQAVLAEMGAATDTEAGPGADAVEVALEEPIELEPDAALAAARRESVMLCYERTRRYVGGRRREGRRHDADGSQRVDSGVAGAARAARRRATVGPTSGEGRGWVVGAGVCHV